MKFRKKPVVVDAIRVCEAIHAASQNWDKLPAWIVEHYEKGNILFFTNKLEIKTLEGMMTAWPDDWIIRGVAGELYPCKSDIFEKTYEMVTD